jgi:hypothetical protein
MITGPTFELLSRVVTVGGHALDVLSMGTPTNEQGDNIRSGATDIRTELRALPLPHNDETLLRIEALTTAILDALGKPTPSNVDALRHELARANKHRDDLMRRPP